VFGDFNVLFCLQYTGKKKGKEGKMSRPFGVAMLIAGYDVDKGPQLFFSDPSGEFILYLI